MKMDITNGTNNVTHRTQLPVVPKMNSRKPELLTKKSIFNFEKVTNNSEQRIFVGNNNAQKNEFLKSLKLVGANEIIKIENNIHSGRRRKNCFRILRSTVKEWQVGSKNCETRKKYKSKIINSEKIIRYFRRKKPVSKNVHVDGKEAKTNVAKYKYNLLRERLKIKMDGTNTRKRIASKHQVHSCVLCEKNFSRKASLMIHMNIHTGEKPYQCCFCMKRFTQDSTLTCHIRTHTREQPYSCRICDKKFSQKSALNNHMRIHTGVKPYQCNFCEKEFRDKSTLVKHKRTHTGEKPYKCVICGKCFNQNGFLAAHMMLHSGDKPFQCDICKMQFRQKVHLVGHMTVHTGEKAYPCRDCDKRFARKSHLARHLNIHTNEKLYYCDLCNMSCNDKCNLIKHIRIHTTFKQAKCD